MDPLAIHHVSVNVSNASESVDFYTGVLGGTVRDDRPELGIGGAWIDFGAQQVHLIETTVPSNLGQHFAVQVDDIDAVIGELRSKGLEVGDAVTIGSDRQTFVDDPSGNLIELHEVALPR